MILLRNYSINRLVFEFSSRSAIMIFRLNPSIYLYRLSTWCFNFIITASWSSFNEFNYLLLLLSSSISDTFPINSAVFSSKAVFCVLIYTWNYFNLSCSAFFSWVSRSICYSCSEDFLSKFYFSNTL